MVLAATLVDNHLDNPTHLEAAPRRKVLHPMTEVQEALGCTHPVEGKAKSCNPAGSEEEGREEVCMVEVVVMWGRT